MRLTCYDANRNECPAPATFPLGMVANYFQGCGRKYLVLTPGPSLSGERIEIEVDGKREARKIVAGAHARPWNF